MEKDSTEQLILDLTLALTYLSCWEEKGITGESMHRAWKGYDFDILDKLKGEGLVDFSYKAKSLYITEEGIEKAKKLTESFGKCNIYL
jgi:hypothetical protein